jgi:mono/diheme cytochrome c family protein
MTNFLRFSLAAALALAFAWAGTVVAAPDAQNGERLARRWCASCHVVASDQRQPTNEAAPFSTVAKMPGFNEARLALFLLDPHPRMPDMNLTRAEAADLADYIEKLGR